MFDNAKIEASPGVTGTCPGCKSPLVAKCGTRKVWHWAHHGKRHCDNWWEPETQWHRSWKDRFPKNWQEYPLRSNEGDLHFADVRTPSGLIIEIQHSHISDQEIRVREKFYGDLVWVVDGTRLKRDRSTFLCGMNENRGLRGNPGEYMFNGNGRQITRRWAVSERPVYLDFGDTGLLHYFCRFTVTRQDVRVMRRFRTVRG
ncbi:competence protein CoiA family protein [uncultured Tateyamaria sp.]|uniref:competence protein CoiA n=1 Tax=Tateyamaria sp. 1078 TaxID=3417464 RepID=UPI0034176E8B